LNLRCFYDDVIQVMRDVRGDLTGIYVTWWQPRTSFRFLSSPTESTTVLASHQSFSFRNG